MKYLGLRNFRKFNELDPLELGGVTFLVGENNSGKSTFTKAAILLGNFLSMMAELLDQVKVLNDKMRYLELNVASATKNYAKGEKELLTTIEVCKMLKVSRITIYRMASRGDIPCYKSGKSLLFYKEDIEQWIHSGKISHLPLETISGFVSGNE